MTRGILPDRMIAAAGASRARSCPIMHFAADQIQPASLDLRLGEWPIGCARAFCPAADTVARAHRRIEAARDRAARRRGAGDGLRLHRAAASKVSALPHDIAARRQSEELDRPARRVYPRDRRQHPRLRPDRRPAIMARSMLEISPRTFPVLVRDGLAAVADSLAPRQCAARCAEHSRAARARAARR